MKLESSILVFRGFGLLPYHLGLRFGFQAGLLSRMALRAPSSAQGAHSQLLTFGAASSKVS